MNQFLFDQLDALSLRQPEISAITLKSGVVTVYLNDGRELHPQTLGDVLEILEPRREAA